MARRVRSRSAVGATIAALLPPSSRMARAKRAARRGATARPIAVLPVAETSGTSGESTSCWPMVASPMRRLERFLGAAPNLATAFSKMAWTARAVKGVFSLGFQTTELPQTRASAAFQLQTATGKLKAEMTPTTPSGCQVSIMRCLARSEGMVRPASWRERPAAKMQMSIISCTSPRPSERILPDSMVTRRPKDSRLARSSSPSRRTSSPRLGAGTRRHLRKALWAAAIAGSALAVMGRWARISPVRGVRTVRGPSGCGVTPRLERISVTSVCRDLVGTSLG